MAKVTPIRILILYRVTISHRTIDFLLYLFAEWSKFVMEHLEGWRSMNLDWVQNYENPLLIVYYEELVLQPKKNVENIINFIGLPINKQYIRCMMRRKEGIYRRRKPYLPFNPFSPELSKVLEHQRKVIYKEVKKRKIYRERSTALSVRRNF